MSVFDIKDDHGWRASAACGEHDPDAMFPEKGPGMVRQLRDAKRICRTCDVLAECFDDVLRRPEQHGVRAGLDEHERRRLNARGAA